MSVMAEKLPSLMIERPKMPRATWDALRAHIVRERQRKKHKLEQSAEVRFLFLSKIKFDAYNLFVTSKNEFSNSQMKCCIKARESYKTTF